MIDEHPYCCLIGMKLDAKIVGKIGAKAYKDNMQACMVLGTQSFRMNKHCHESNCQSHWRVCPACVIQGEVKRIADKKEIFSLGLIEGKDCCLCSFHHLFGPDKRRSDRGLVEVTLKAFSLPIEADVVRDRNVEYKKIPLPQLSDFFHQKEREVVSLYSKVINNKMSPEEAKRLRGEIMAYFVKRHEKCIREQAAKTDNFEIVSVYEDDQPAIEISVEVEPAIVQESVPVISEKPKRKYRRRIKKDKAKEEVAAESSTDDFMTQAADEEVSFSGEVDSAGNVHVEEQFSKYAHLEDSSHGICTEQIIVPSWHPQLFFNEDLVPEYISLIEEGHVIDVNVLGDCVELIDDVGFLMAAKKMGLRHPPLEISKYAFPDVCMLLCFKNVNLSEWEKYRLFSFMLKYTKEKTLAKWVELKEIELKNFMQQGNKISEKGDEVLFMQLVIENTPLIHA